MKKTEQKAIRFISENKLLKKGEKVLIALSGGPDSVFLLHFLNKLKKKFEIEFGAVHINHLLRGKNSDRDELFCKTICAELKIPFYSIRKNVNAFAKKNKLSIEIAARKIRYNFFKDVCSKNNFDKILTAHNSDDNAETVLLNLVKGTGLKGIAGIPVIRENIIRPILCLTKIEILDYLESNQFEFRIDESNLKNDFERNFLRNKVIPLLKESINPSLSKNILTTSLNLQKVVTEIDESYDHVKSLIKFKASSFIKIPVDILTRDNVFLAYAIKQIFVENFSVKIGSSDIKKIFSIIHKQTGCSEELSGKLILKKERNEIVIEQKTAPEKEVKISIKINEEKNIGDKFLEIKKIHPQKIIMDKSKYKEFISAEKLKTNFIVRNWVEGDKFFPIGMKGTKKISDYLNDIKISSFEKKNQLILENDGKIVWVIGQRLDDRFKIKPETKKALQLCLR